MGQVATVSCVVAAGPSRAAGLLAAAMTATGRLGVPDAWFDPAGVPRRAAALGVEAGSGFARRYLDAVAGAGRGPGAVWSARASWTDMKWLLHALRLDPATPSVALDHEIVAARWPGLLYVLVADDDPAGTALERRPGGRDDQQWVRWLEEATVRDEERWRLYLRRSGEAFLELRTSEVERDPAGAAARVGAWLGVEAPVPAGSEAALPNPDSKAAPPDPDTRAGYLAARPGLSAWPVPAGAGV